LGIFGLLAVCYLVLGGTTTARAVEAPSIISPSNSGLATVVQDSTGAWFAQVTVAGSGEYLASWERNAGVWESPEQAVALGLTPVATCRQQVVSSFLNRYPTQAELYTHFTFNDDGSWKSPELLKEIQDKCISGAQWTDAQTLGSVDKDGNWVVDIPLYKMPPGQHLVFIMGVDYSGTSGDPSCSRTFEDGSWIGYDCIASYSAPTYYQINIPVPSDSGMKGNSTLPGALVAPGSFFDQSAFSTLPKLDLGALAPKALAAAGATMVLAILMAIPTHLVSEATSGGIGLLSKYRWLRWINGTVRGWAAIPLMLVGALIASFSDPSFGLNWMSLRLLLTVFVAFVVMDYGAIQVSWWFTRNATGQERPEISGRPIFLVVIAATVVFARLTNIEPAMVFGAVIALDLGSRLSKATEAAVALISTGYVISVGVIAWFAYSALTAYSVNTFNPAGMNPAEIINYRGWLSFGQVTVGEWLSVFTVTALSTIPLSLLPFEGFGGRSIFLWKKWVWVVVYAIGFSLYVTLFFPSENAWTTSNKPMVAWLIIFVIYMLVGLTLYFWVRGIKERREREEALLEAVAIDAAVEQEFPSRRTLRSQD
jgi:hypothetical protein